MHKTREGRLIPSQEAGGTTQERFPGGPYSFPGF